MKRVASVALVAVAVLLHAGCGYALAGRGSFLPANIMTVGIPEFINSTPFFGIEQMLTEKIRSEFIGRGKYTIVIDAAGADAVLTGQVTGVTVQPVGFTEQQLASRYLFAVTMRLSFTDARTNEVLWSNDSMTFREEYELATRGTTALDGGSFLDQERSSFERISSDVARTVVTAILEAF
jgi:hypothetical protein